MESGLITSSHKLIRASRFFSIPPPSRLACCLSVNLPNKYSPRLPRAFCTQLTMWNLPSSKYVKEFEPKLNSYNNNNSSSNTMMLLKKERSNTEDTQDSSRCDDQDDLPDIIPVSSLASFSDSSTMSSTLSPGAGAPISPSPPLPVRSIFKSYWNNFIIKFTCFACSYSFVMR